MKKYPAFDRKSLLIVDVNKTVIEKFDQCHYLREMEGYKDLPNKIKEFIEKETETETENCIDLLGVYISPQDEDQANILLSKEKIKAITSKNNYQDNYSLYDFIKLHEVAHAYMCPKLAKGPICTRNKTACIDVLIEESLATAIALKRMKSHPDYKKLENFVQTQPAQYKLGIVVLKNHEKNLEAIMRGWKACKRQCQLSSASELPIVLNELLIALLCEKFDEFDKKPNIGNALYQCSDYTFEELASQIAIDNINAWITIFFLEKGFGFDVVKFDNFIQIVT